MKNPDATTEPPPLPWIVRIAAYGLLTAAAAALGAGLAGWLTGEGPPDGLAIVLPTALGAGLFARRKFAQTATSGLAVLGCSLCFVVTPLIALQAFREAPNFPKQLFLPDFVSHRLQALADAGVTAISGVLLLRLANVLHRPEVDELFDKGRPIPQIRRFSIKTLLLVMPLVAVFSLAFASRYQERGISETTQCPTAADGSPVIIKYGVRGESPEEELVYCAIAVGEPGGSVEMAVDMKRNDDLISLRCPENELGVFVMDSLMVFDYEEGSGLAPARGVVTIDELEAYLSRGADSGYGWSASGLVEFAKASRRAKGPVLEDVAAD